jgi:8-oxo-dGTP diphosphatase
MDKNPQPRAIVSAIIEKNENNIRYLFLQTRWKPAISPQYSGLLEIPAGGIDTYENVFNTLKREVKEETGLDIVKIISDYEGKVEENILGNKAIIFQPFVCQQMLESNGGLPWVGFVFRCEAKGEVSINTKEAKDPCWVTIDELKSLLSNSPELFFPLQYPVLKYYVEKVISENKVI